MRNVLRSTAMLSSSSVLGILTGLITGKLSALWIGPEGMGFLGAVRSTMILGGLLLGWGMSIGVTRVGAKLLSDNDSYLFSIVVSTALCTVALTISLAALLILPFSHTIGTLLYGVNGVRYPSVLLWLLLSIFGNVAGGVASGVLRAHLTYIKSLSIASVINVVLTFAVSIIALSSHDVKWMLPVFAASAMSHALVLWVMVRKHHLLTSTRPSLAQIRKASQILYRFCVPYTFSTLAGTGTQSLLPVLILHWAGTHNLGYYVAATTVASQYLSFLTGAMGQDYLPRLSAEENPHGLQTLVVEQLHIILLIIVPIVTLVIIAAPVAIPLVYSSSFKVTISLVQWMVAADIFRFGSWSITFAIMGKRPGKYFFSLELFGGLGAVFFSWLGFHLGGIAGLGWGYFIDYIAFSLAAVVVGAHILPLRLSAFPVRPIILSIAIVFFMRGLSLMPASAFSMTAMSLIVLFAVWRSVRQLRRGWNLGLSVSTTS